MTNATWYTCAVHGWAEWAPCPYPHGARHRCPPHDLDAAWAEAEALVEGGNLNVFSRPTWAEVSGRDKDDGHLFVGTGPTPAAALRDLAERLREVK